MFDAYRVFRRKKKKEKPRKKEAEEEENSRQSILLYDVNDRLPYLLMLHATGL